MTRAGYKKHRALIEAWAEGKEVQYESTHGNWINCAEPDWEDDWEYRLKPKVPNVVTLRLGTFVPLIVSSQHQLDKVNVAYVAYVELTDEVRAAVEHLIGREDA